MGAVEHLKTLCCLGLTPESAMIAVTPPLHEIIPHGTTRAVFFEPDATVHAGYAENPATAAIWLEHAWRFMDDPTSPMSLWMPGFRAAGIGWILHLQGRGWLECGWYRDVEAPLDSCWILDAVIADAGRAIAGMHLTRPRSARPFTVDDVQRLDPLRPWLAHAFRRRSSDTAEELDLAGMTGAPVLSGQMVFTADQKNIYQTISVEHLLWILAGEPVNFRRHIPARDTLPTPILKLLQRVVGCANGTSNTTPPHKQISTPYGVLTLEAKWLVPAGVIPADIAKDPKSCLIAVTIELREHALAHAARVLRESGATPAQVKVGVQLALGKGKPAIADHLGIKIASVRDLTEKLYQTLDVHNAAELGTKIWLGQKRSEAEHLLHAPASGSRWDLYHELQIRA
jgi:DNA-binding CsgD family transcriptional regulator